MERLRSHFSSLVGPRPLVLNQAVGLRDRVGERVRWYLEPEETE